MTTWFFSLQTDTFYSKIKVRLDAVPFFLHTEPAHGKRGLHHANSMTTAFERHPCGGPILHPAARLRAGGGWREHRRQPCCYPLPQYGQQRRPGPDVHPQCGSHRHGCQLRQQHPGWRHRYSGHRYKRRPNLYGHSHWSLCVRVIFHAHQCFQRIHPGHGTQHWQPRFHLLQRSCNGHLCRGFPIEEHWEQRFLGLRTFVSKIQRDQNTRFCRDNR